MTERKIDHHCLGVVLAILAGATWGTTSVSSRYLAHVRGINPAITVFWRVATSLPFLLIAFKLWGRGARLEKRDFWKVVGLGALGVFLMANLNFYSTRYTTNINSTIIITASAVLIALIARFFGEAITRGQWVGVTMGLVGVMFIGFAKSPKESELSTFAHAGGITLATLASLSWALYTYLGRGMVSKYGGIRVTLWCIAAGAAMQTLFLTAQGLSSGGIGQAFIPKPAEGAATLGDWAVLVYLGLVPTAVGFTLWFIAIRYIDVTTLGMGQYIGPVISTSLGWLLLGEVILWQHVLGASLIFAGLHFAARRPASPHPESANQ